MNTEINEVIYVRVKDSAGNDFVCPLNELRDARKMSDIELEKCFEGNVAERYAGQLNIVDSGD